MFEFPPKLITGLAVFAGGTSLAACSELSLSSAHGKVHAGNLSGKVAVEFHDSKSVTYAFAFKNKPDLRFSQEIHCKQDGPHGNAGTDVTAMQTESFGEQTGYNQVISNENACSKSGAIIKAVVLREFADGQAQLF